MAIRSYRDLMVWQLSMELARAVHSTTGRWALTEVLGRELRRTSISIPSNIAEGYGRGSTREYLQYLRIAMGSVAELDTQLRLAAMMNLLSATESTTLLESIDHIGRKLNRLRQALHPR